MADRLTPLSTATSPVTGAAYMDDIADEVRELWDRCHTVLTSIGGSANAVTASVSPALGSRGLRVGMLFSWVPVASNTGAMTLQLPGLAAAPILQPSGAALVTGQVLAGTTYLMAWAGSAFILLTATVTPRINDRQMFTALGGYTWSKPVGCPDNALVRVRLWAGGGAGAAVAGTANGCGGGGGGGQYFEEVFRAGDLPSSVSGTIGSGGAVGALGTAGGAGGDTTFGALLRAGGGGGGQIGYTTTGAGGIGGSITGFPAGIGGNGGTLTVAPSWPTTSVSAGASVYSGGAGGAAARSNNAGGYVDVGAAGTSQRGGAGGAAGAAGTAPAGGGGVNGAGARGQAEIITQG